MRNSIRFGMGLTKQLAVRFPEELLVALDEAIGLGSADKRSSAIVFLCRNGWNVSVESELGLRSLLNT